MVNVLHLSDTTLSGSPIRIVKLLNKYSTRYRAHHIVWFPILQKRVFELDMVGEELRKDEIMHWLKWADIIHYHNRWRRQMVFTLHGLTPPEKPSVIQIHSPRFSEDFTQEAESKIPLAIIAQYHPRQWPECSYIVPNVVDILDKAYMPIENKPLRPLPIVSYAPSNVNARGWDNKGYGLVVPYLKRMMAARSLSYQLIYEKPHNIAMELKRGADIGIDEIATGSYHLSSLEYMAMGVPCFANIDGLTANVVKELTGADTLPWIQANRDSFVCKLTDIIRRKAWLDMGRDTRKWMETYWHPNILVKHYEDMYDDLG